MMRTSWIAAVRWPLAILAGSLLLLALSGYLRYRGEQQIRNLRIEVSSLQERINEMTEMSRISRQIRQPFETLQQAGFLDVKRGRSAWIQAVAQAVDDSGVYSARFEMKPSETASLDEIALDGGILRQVPLIVNLQLAHEGDLVAFLRSIIRHPGGIMQNRYCLIVPVMEERRVALDAPNLHATCRFDWYVVQPVSSEMDAADDESDLDPEGLE